jgi:hypothetical protein
VNNLFTPNSVEMKNHIYQYEYPRAARPSDFVSPEIVSSKTTLYIKVIANWTPQSTRVMPTAKAESQNNILRHKKLA